MKGLAMNQEQNESQVVRSLRQRIAELEAAQTQLRHSQQFLQRQVQFVLGATRTGLDIIDSELNIRYIDPEWEKVYGDPAGKKCHEYYFAGRNSPCPDCGVLKALEAKTRVVTERVIEWQGPRTIQVTSMPFQDERGDWLVAEVNVDITERKLAEEALRESEEKYRTLVEAAGDAIMALDENGTYLFMNSTAAHRLGKEPRDLIGKTIWDLFPKELSDLHIAKVRAVLESGQGRVAESPTVVQGEQRWYRTSIQPLGSASRRPRVALVIAADITDARQAADALGRSEAVNRALLDASGERAMLLEADGTIVALNEAAAKSLGSVSSELVGRRACELMPPALAESRRAKILEVVGSRRPLRFEDLHEGRILDNHIYPVFGSEGNVSHLAVFSLDVTEQKLAQEALAESEERYRDLFENAPVCVFEEDFTKVPPLILRVNRKTEETYGWSEQEFVSLPVERVVPPEAIGDMQKVARELRAGRSITLEGLNRRRDGSVFPIRLSATVSPTSGPERVIVTIEDITERKRAEEALRESKERLQYVIDNTGDIIFQIDLQGNYTFANQAAEGMTGFPVSRLMQMNLREMVAPDCLPRVMERLRRRIAGQEVEQPYCFDILHKDGHRVSLELKTTGAYRDGELVAIQGIARDVTERKRVEEALRAAQHKLTMAREEERKHLAGELHDSVGQKLVVLQLAVQKALAASKGEADAATLRGAAEKCGDLIREVRQMAHGLYPPTLESLGLVAALRQLCEFCRAARKTCGIYCPDSLRKARLPQEAEIALFRIAQEAVSNAVRHSGAGRIGLRLGYRDGQATLRITDDGAGFDAQGASENGLGLTMMRERADAVGGRLAVVSRAGSTCVEVSVPAVLRKPGKGPSGAARPTPRRAPKPARSRRGKE
jgi:PAS domain S-box-containing protein